MVLKKRITVSWSGGKDSAFALYKMLLSEEYEVAHLHTVIGKETKRVGLHGIREELIDRQAQSLGIPLIKLYLETSDDHSAYEKLVKEFYRQCAGDKIEGIMFGDIFLEDLKQYREELLRESGLTPIYPIWKMDTRNLLDDFIRTGFKTVVCAVNGNFFSSEQLGHTLDRQFIDSIFPGVDPCGENGEFHTFVYDGPLFQAPVLFDEGKIVSKEYAYKMKRDDGSVEQVNTTFWFQDFVPRIAS